MSEARVIYKTKRAAHLSLTEFTPAWRNCHRVVSATINGAHVGWTVVVHAPRQPCPAVSRGGRAALLKWKHLP